MTKKELMESKLWSCLPDDAEIVFHTANRAHYCTPLRTEDLHVAFEEQGVLPASSLYEEFDNLSHSYKTFLVIEGIEWELLKHRYGISIKLE